MMMMMLSLSCRGPCEEAPGCLVAEDLPGAVLSVRAGSTPGEVWMVGASADPLDGSGPLILRRADTAWERLDTSEWDGLELWWAWIDSDEAVFVGSEGLILELDRSSGSLTRADGPDQDVTFFGVWGADADQVWAVGMTAGGSGPPALWRRDEGVWAAVDGGHQDGDILFKVHGRAHDDVWFVGAGGLAQRWDGERLIDTATDLDVPTDTAPLLTVDVSGERPVAVGGQTNALILEHDGDDWRDASPEFQPGLNGVCARDDVAWAVGQRGSRSTRDPDGIWSSDDGALTPTLEDWHACAIDSDGGLWTVGGRVAARPLIRGVVGYQGPDEPPALDWD